MATPFHKKYHVNSTAEIMYAIYKFVLDNDQGVVDFVVDTGETALWVDKAGDDGAPDQYVTSVSSAHAFGGVNSFMVLDVQFNSPGGRAWQVKILRSSTFVISVEGSPNGGWSIASATSGATDSFVGEPTTGARTWLSNTPSAAGDHLYLSSNDADVYGAGDKYGYLRAIFYDQSADTLAWGFYAGGYLPFDEVNDTDPFLLLAGVPRFGNGTDYWGSTSTGSSNENRIPVENGLATTSMAATGYATIVGPPYMGDPDESRTRNGGLGMTAPLFVHGISPSVCVGTLGAETMVAISEGTPDLTTNATHDRMVVNNLGIRWEE